MPRVFEASARIGAPVEEVFAWHERVGAFERLAPPWTPVTVETRSGGIREGGRVVLVGRFGPLPGRWVLEHHDYIVNRQFRDEQCSGPFHAWSHLHRFEPAGADACTLKDHIEYTLPGGALGGALAGSYAERQLERLFRYRHEILVNDLAALRRWHDRPRLKILISGASGMIGAALVPYLTTQGHQVQRLVRSRARAGESAIYWRPEAGQIDSTRLEGFDAVIHLAGENIAGRWTPEKKRHIEESRVKGTALLSRTLAGLERPPRVFIAASATGYYGDRGEQTLTEESEPGAGFLAGVCRAWEEATAPAAARATRPDREIRVVNLRLGMVLTPAGGGLGKMLPAFALGAGGRIGTGRQYLSWVAIDDAIGAIEYAMMIEDLRGPVNGVAPGPVRNIEFTRALGRVLRRPTPFTVPAAVARAAFGEMADAALLASCRVRPERLEEAEYQFLYPDLEPALRHVLGRG